MELYQLRSFVTVADEKHLTRAAKRLFISQPAVSAHIKGLEEELGITLFTRTPQGMQLTKEGQVLKVQAEKSLNTVHEFFQQAKFLRDDLVEVVKIGLNTDPEFLKLGDFFSVMTENYPKLEFHLLQRSSWEVVDELRAGNLDAGYSYGKEPFQDIAVVPLRRYDVFIVGPVGWKKQIEQAGWQEIAKFPWIWPSDYCPFCQLIAKEFQSRHLSPIKKAAVVDEEPVLKTLVTSGAGLSLMVADEAIAAEQEGTITVWRKDKLQTDLSFLYLQNREQTPVIQAILKGIFIVWDLAVHEAF